MLCTSVARLSLCLCHTQCALPAPPCPRRRPCADVDSLDTREFMAQTTTDQYGRFFFRVDKEVWDWCCHSQVYPDIQFEVGPQQAACSYAQHAKARLPRGSLGCRDGPREHAALGAGVCVVS